MIKHKKFSFTKRVRSFAYAFNGLRVLIREEHNAQIHIIATICVLIACIAFNVSLMEWIAVVFCIGAVVSMELINTAIENIADFISPQKNDAIKKIKDLSAAAVLVAATASAIIGAIVFLPKVIDLF